MQVQRQSRLLRILSGLFGVGQRFPESHAIVLRCNCGESFLCFRPIPILTLPSVGRLSTDDFRLGSVSGQGER
jgi:hypothetical protein